MHRRWYGLIVVALGGSLAHAAGAQTPSPTSPAARQEAERLDQMPPVSPDGTGHIDHSGRNEKGRVSYYASSFANKTMANGRPMDPHSTVAASKTLPLGSTAKVTNLQNGKTATVRIEDRGPYVKGRVVDVSPKVADQLDLKHQGVASAVVKPITVPQPDGAVKLGAGAATASPEEIKQATQITKQLTGQSEAAEK